MKGLTERAFLALLGVVISLSPVPSWAQTKGAASPPEAIPFDTAGPVLIRQASNYSLQHTVVVVAISKGQKESRLTGDQIGQKFAELFKTAYEGVPSKYIVAPGGDYTGIAFFVKGHAYGPYGLEEALTGMGLAAASYWDVTRSKRSP